MFVALRFRMGAVLSSCSSTHYVELEECQCYYVMLPCVGRYWPTQLHITVCTWTESCSESVSVSLALSSRSYLRFLPGRYIIILITLLLLLQDGYWLGSVIYIYIFTLSFLLNHVLNWLVWNYVRCDEVQVTLLKSRGGSGNMMR